MRHSQQNLQVHCAHVISRQPRSWKIGVAHSGHFFVYALKNAAVSSSLPSDLERSTPARRAELLALPLELAPPSPPLLLLLLPPLPSHVAM